MCCLKCRHVTGTENNTSATSKNCRLMRRGQCIACGKTKTQFVRRGPAGGSFLITFVNKLPFEMHLLGHNFTGPGTKLDKRLNSDGTSKKWSITIKTVGNAAYHHDLYYSEHDDTKTRNQTMLNVLNGIVNPTLRERIDKSIVRKLINAKVNFGLGAPIQIKKS